MSVIKHTKRCWMHLVAMVTISIRTHTPMHTHTFVSGRGAFFESRKRWESTSTIKPQGIICFRLNQSDYPQITLFSVVPEESHYPQWWCHAPKNIICRIATLSGLFSHKNLMGLLVSSAPSFLHGTGSISALAGSSCTLQILLFYHLI